MQRAGRRHGHRRLSKAKAAQEKNSNAACKEARHTACKAVSQAAIARRTTAVRAAICSKDTAEAAKEDSTSLQEHAACQDSSGAAARLPETVEQRIRVGGVGPLPVLRLVVWALARRHCKALGPGSSRATLRRSCDYYLERPTLQCAYGMLAFAASDAYHQCVYLSRRPLLDTAVRGIQRQ